MAEPLGTYAFLPWLRQGIAARIGTVDPLGQPSSLVERATVDVSLAVNGGTPIEHTVQVAGPGDVIGINPRAIVRTEPRAWITDFEENYLPFVEFYDEDFPWRYTPAAATTEHRLRPWIFLAVLKEGEFERRRVPGAPLGAIALAEEAAALLPRPDQTWAWAHVHVSKDITDGATRTVPQSLGALEQLLEGNADEACARLMSPRRLEPETGYFAFVVPTFETGRCAGLGQPSEGINALEPAWGDGQLELPVYYEWYFRTAETGDFEQLVKLLEARPVDDRVGTRDMDVQKPEYGVPGLVDPPVVALEGALRAPGTASRPSSWPPDPRPPFVSGLERVVNLQTELLQAAGPDGHPDPIISPPLYGRWHARIDRLTAADPGWVNELNGDPRLRVPAGVGTRVVQKGQEAYVQRSWQQLGDVLEANRRIRHIQLSIAASHRLYARNLLPLADAQLLVTTQPVLSRVQRSPETVRRHIDASRLPAAALNPAFRRITRPRGPVVRRLPTPGPSLPRETIERLNAGEIAAAPPKTAPPAQLELDDGADQLVPAGVPDWLRILLPMNRRVLGALLLIVLALTVPAGLALLAIPAVVVIAVLFVASERLRRSFDVAEAASESGLTTARVQAVPSRPAFVVTQPGSAAPANVPRERSGDSGEAAALRTAVTDLHARFELALPTPVLRQPLSLRATAQTVTTALNPVRTIPARARAVLTIPPTVRPQRPVLTIDPVMAHPVFADAMYAPLRDESADLLIPNLELIPMNTVSLLETNRRFIESYMVGVNHEMSRELLWREFPTDQRGSYFRQFWDVGDVVNRDASLSTAEIEERLRDIAPIHTWSRDTALGTHESRSIPTGDEPDAPRLVLVIRGELLKRYPTAVVFAQRGTWGVDEFGRDVRVLDETDPASNVRTPAFAAEIEPDVRCLGFDLTADEVRGSAVRSDDDAGWFFVIQERPGEPRFGMDLPADDAPPRPRTWNDLTWSHLATPEPIRFIDVEQGPETDDITAEPDASIHWGSNAADMAYILFQTPVMVAFHASDMLADLIEPPVPA